MTKKLYVGNLPYKTTEEELRAMFVEYGTVESAAVVIDKFSGRSKGYGFVEMPEEDAQKAIEGLNGKEIDGRAIIVNEARPREDRGTGNFDNNRGGFKPRFDRNDSYR